MGALKNVSLESLHLSGIQYLVQQVLSQRAPWWVLYITRDRWMISTVTNLLFPDTPRTPTSSVSLHDFKGKYLSIPSLSPCTKEEDLGMAIKSVSITNSFVE
jgi:hypothetical protein